MAQLDVRPLLAFLDPFGVNEQERFFPRRESFVPSRRLDGMRCDEHRAMSQCFPVRQFHRLVAQAEQAGVHLGGEFVTGAQILAHRLVEARLLVGTAVRGLAGATFQGFEPAPPVLRLAPAGQSVTELVAVFFDQIHALAAGVPEQV